MNSQKVAGILGTIVAAAVLVIAFMYGPIGQIAKARGEGSEVDGAVGGTAAARREGTGGARGAAVSLSRRSTSPLAERPGRPYLVSNGDVDAS